MAVPLSSSVPAIQAIKDEGIINIAPSGQVHCDQYYMDIRNQVQCRKLPIMGQRATGSAEPAPPPPVQQTPPPPPPSAHRAWTKRSATGPPPGLAGFRQPPQKQQQPQPPWHRAQHAPQPAPNAHRTPDPPGMPPVSTSKPPPHPRSSAKPLAVACGVCDVRCMTMLHLKQHEQGRKHRNKVAYIAGEKNVQCQVCNVHLSSELNVAEHNAGKQHLRRLFLCGANGATGNQTT